MGALALFVAGTGFGVVLGEVGGAVLGGEAVGGGVAEELLEGRDVEEPDARGLVNGRGDDAPRDEAAFR